MLTIEHRAYHLYREDAYHEYCMSVDIYQAFQPASFIYLSFEAFKDMCAEQGLSLVYQGGQPITYEGQVDFPWKRERDVIPDYVEPRGLILRINSDKDIPIVQEALKQGRNVLVLIPSASLTHPWPHTDVLDKASQKLKLALPKLDIQPGNWEITGDTYYGSEARIHWEEIETHTLGRLFVTRDAFLSDGFFLEGYGFSSENQMKIQSLIKAFACFKTNFIRLSYRNLVQSWPTGEPLTIIVDVSNHGPSVDEVNLNIEIGSEFEALSPLEREIRPLQSLDRTSFALQLVPRVDGNFPMIVGASASLRDGSPCRIHSEQLDLSVVPALRSSQRSSVPQDDETLSRLIKIFHAANMGKEVEKLPELARLDVRSCLNRIRSVTERILFNYIDTRRINCRERTLDAAIRALKSNNSFSNRTIGYLHTIRVIGNLGSHATDDPLTDVDVRILSYALASVVEEFIEQNAF